MPGPEEDPSAPQPIVIEAITPQIDGGRHAVKRVVGDEIEVAATIFKDGHDVLAAAVLYRAASDAEWLEAAMEPVGDARWTARFQVQSNEQHWYTVAAWIDRFASWRRDMRKRIDANQDVATELVEGAAIVREAAARAPEHDQLLMERALARAEQADNQTTAADILLHADLAQLVARWQPRHLFSRYAPALPLGSTGRGRASRAGTSSSPARRVRAGRAVAPYYAAEQRLPAIAAMGFDVVYLPPIHPIGRTARKGPNNSLSAGPDDRGSPWAIGSDAGGHTAIEPGLGTLEDFDRFVARAGQLGMEIAMDLAIQCSPDHPWVREHSEWFFHRPDGTIKYAENPPKKYQDIYPMNFWGPHREALWNELLRVVQFWIARGIRTFRVDNPHTKPVAFWAWLIARVHETRPDVIFLAEAFTVPWMMRELAKVGFSESYTYFTWKTTKGELTEYFTELTRSEMKEYYRGNLWPNTPDILHEFLQKGGRPAFRIRAALAATLSPLWGLYSGYELFENVPVREGSEEYLDSEKYQYKPRDWCTPDTLVPYITRLNLARRANRALQLYDNLYFAHADDPHVIVYVKATPDRSNVVVVAVNLDPFHAHASDVWLEPALLGVEHDEEYTVRDVLTDQVFHWRGGRTWVRLDPFAEPAHVLVVQKVPARPGH
jgi:starch synthase (maltosyl-transferring)